jgi:uncharacterized protein YerC
MELDEALAELLGDQRTGDMHADLITAGKETLRRREINSACGGEVIAAMLRAGMTYRDIERETKIPRSTAQNWAVPPKRSEPGGAT